jgi:hypothetical protein
MNRFEKCEVTLKADLAEISRTLDFVHISFRVSAQSGNIISRVADDRELRELLVELQKKKLTEITAVYQALFVQVWAAFELFIRNLIIAYVEEFCVAKSDFSALQKQGLIDRNIHHTGITFQQVFENRSNVVIDFYAMAKNVATAVPASDHVVLNSSAFAMFLKGPNSDGIKDAFKRIGISKFDWIDIASAPRLQKVFDTKRTVDTSRAIEKFLVDATKKRNNIVHRGDGLVPITEGELRHELKVIEALAGALKETLKRDCDKKCA